MKQIKTFDYDSVYIENGVLKSQSENGFLYYLNISNDSLLKSYRKRAQLEAPGEDMGGWYDFQDSPGGHLIGHVISGLSRVYRNSGVREALDKVNYLIHEFGKTISDDGYFYNYPMKEDGLPDYYVYDKLAIGLLDAYRYADNEEALPILSRITDWVIKHVSLEKLDLEWYTLPENLYECYDITHDKKYMELAVKLTYHSWYDALFQQMNVLPGRHAYSHVNALCSAAKIYMETQDKKYFQVIRYAFDMIAKEQMYASGGYGPGEAFVVSQSDTLREALLRPAQFNKFNTNKSHEASCNSYALIKLSRYMLNFTGDSFYGDIMEKVIFNTFLGTLKPVGKGITHYYDTYRPGAVKTYFTEQNNQTWPCCAGTYLQVLADYPKDIYFCTDEEIFINLFVASSVIWSRESSRVMLQQITDFPESDAIRLKITTDRQEGFDISVRVPEWAMQGIEIRMNGKEIPADARPGCFFRIPRKWKDGDIVDIVIKKQLRTEKISMASPDMCAVLYGPILLTGQTLTDALPLGQEEFLHSLVPIPGHPLTFTTTDLSPNIIFRPYYSIQDQVSVYTTYFKFNCSAPDSVLLDDIHTHWIYDDKWKKVYKREFEHAIYRNDFIHCTQQNGAAARINFEGTAVKLISSRTPLHGRISVRVDGYPAEIVELNNQASLKSQAVWEKAGLLEGMHTVVIAADMTEDEQSKGAVVEIDSLEIVPSLLHKR